MRKTPKAATMSHEFVEFIPGKLEPGKLYVSIQFATVAHACACGCGHEVVTPLTPTDWKLIFDGETISLHPSIGNWSFECQSHYWIRNSKIVWAGAWSEAEIKAGRDSDRRSKNAYFDDAPESKSERESMRTEGVSKGGLRQRAGKFLRSIWR